MGNGSGFLSAIHQGNEDAPKSTGLICIVSDKLEESSNILIHNPEVRTKFVRFFLRGFWIKDFVTRNSNMLAFEISLSSLLECLDHCGKLSSTKTESSDIDCSPSSKLNASPLSLYLADAQHMAPLLMACAYPIFLTAQGRNLSTAQEEEEFVSKEDQLKPLSRQSTPSAHGDIESFAITMSSFDKQIHLSRQATVSLDCTISFHHISPRKTISSHREDFLPHQSRFAETIHKHLNTIPLNCAGHIAQHHPYAGYLGLLDASLHQLPISVAIASVSANFFQQRDFNCCKHNFKHTNNAIRTSVDIIRDGSLPILYVNQACEEFLRRPRSDLLHSSAHHLLSLPATFEGKSQLAQFHRALDLMQPLEMVVRHFGCDGLQQNVLVVVKPVMHPALGVYTHVIIMHYLICSSPLRTVSTPPSTAPTTPTSLRDGATSPMVPKTMSAPCSSHQHLPSDLAMVELLANLLPSVLL